MTDSIDSIDQDRLRQQDHKAFEALVSQLHIPMVSVARAIIGDSLAEEVVQEAWVSAYRNLPRFEGRSSIKTWLFTIVSNEAKSRLRKEKRMVALEDITQDGSVDYLSADRFQRFGGHWKVPPPDWHLDSPDQLLEERHLQKCIDHTVSILPPQQRAVFILRDIEQQALAEICNILEVTESYVRVLLHRARLKLMQVIDRYQETGEC
ncbi:MAG: RNA polymerase subunit sigma [Pseudomonadales bacterium]|nr:RNA polymerase subunit sigma [Pseudomonadales bacterium]RLU04101.1 MAG: RNA polymerase sigma factor [Ketobacter sp.]